MKNIIFIIVLFSVSLAMSQETSLDITPPSPAAYALTKFEAQQPSLYTGTANISIPLYTIDFDGWKLPLSLSYHASGIQTNQEATEVGLGWSLNSTAVITRRVQQNNDFQNTSISKGYVYETGKKPIEYIDDFENWNNLTETERIFIEIQLEYGLRDSEPDIFDYNFFGFSGSFVLTNKDPNNGVIGIIQLKKDGVKIEFNENSKEFTITTPTGFVGDFTVKERSTNMGGAGPLGTAENGNYGGLIDLLGIQNRGNFRVITGWYVSKITSPKGKEITFEYNDDIEGNSSHVSMNSTSYGQHFTVCPEDYNDPCIWLESYSRQIHEHVYQESISISDSISEELNISFTMEDREDLQKNNLYANDFPVSPQNPKRYTNIQITGLNPMSTFSKSITFNQSYFNLEYLHDNTTANEKYQYLRGRLDNVVIDDQTYSFSYNLGQKGLPNKSTKGVDLFGYYNGKDANTFVYGVSAAPSLVSFPVECPIFLNQPSLKYYYQGGLIQSDHDYAVAGTLNKINYPMGGSSTYIYESHDYYVPGGSGATIYFTAEAIDQNGNAGDVITGGIRIKEIETKNSNGEITSKKSYQYKNSLGNSAGTRLSPLAFYQDNRFHEDINNETCLYFFIHNSANLLGQNTAEGKKIGYSRVTENVIGFNEIYKKDYFFENHANEYGTTFSTLTRRSNINGKLNSTLDLNNLSVVQIRRFQLLDSVTGYIKAFRYSGRGHSGYNQGVLMPMIYQLPIGFVEVEHVKTTSYFDSGDIETNVDYEYDSIMQINAEELTNSKGQKIRTVIKRLKDYPSSCIYASDGITCLYTAMKDKNMVNPVLEKINYVDNIVVSAIGYKYDLEHGNLVLRELYKHDASKGAFTGSTNGFQFTGSYELEVTYDDYDIEGNILQYTQINGLITSFIWGYDNEYPIVKGENITFLNLLLAHNQSSGLNYENLIRSSSLTSDAFISTYEYNPLVGVTKITDPSGQSVDYQYDNLRRLNSVTDINSNLVQKYEYNYGSPINNGGLVVNSSLDIGVVTPGTSNTKYITIQNSGNYDITINDLSLPTYFSSVWDNNAFIIKAGEAFQLPITFNSPSIAVNQVNGILTLHSLNNSSGDITVNLSAVGENETRILTIPQLCYLITYSFQTISVRIDNDGNAPLTISSVISDDALIEPLNTNGLVIQPNSYVEFSVQLTRKIHYKSSKLGVKALFLMY